MKVTLPVPALPRDELLARVVRPEITVAANVPVHVVVAGATAVVTGITTLEPCIAFAGAGPIVMDRIGLEIVNWIGVGAICW